jgi:hypothetical protein
VTGATRAHALAAAAAATGLLALSAAAATPGVSPGGWPYIEGSTALQDEVVLQAHQRQYSLLVMTAARGDDTTLPGVRVRVLDGEQAAGFDRVLHGPWLLIDLPPGRYEVDASHRGLRQRQPVVIGAGDHQAMVFYFEQAGTAPAD